MSRCLATKEFEIHHKVRSGGNCIENAQVLCQPCHENTPSYGVAGESPQPFQKKQKKRR